MTETLESSRSPLQRPQKRVRNCVSSWPIHTQSPLEMVLLTRVISSLMLHHLTRSEKLATLGEMRRVLRPGGELDVADWGRPHNFLMVLLSWTVRLGDRLGRTLENLKGLLPDLFRDAGFSDVAETMRFATVFGTLQLYRGRRPGVDRSQNAA